MLASSFVICDINNPYIWLLSSCYLLQTYISFVFILSVQYLTRKWKVNMPTLWWTATKFYWPVIAWLLPKNHHFFFWNKRKTDNKRKRIVFTWNGRLEVELTFFFFFHANFLSVGYRYWDISQMNRDKLEKARFYSFHDTNFLYLFLVKAAIWNLASNIVLYYTQA